MKIVGVMTLSDKPPLT